MGRAKKIYEWLKNVLWIINRQKDKDYIKINEKINIIKKIYQLERLIFIHK